MSCCSNSWRFQDDFYSSSRGSDLEVLFYISREDFSQTGDTVDSDFVVWLFGGVYTENKEGCFYGLVILIGCILCIMMRCLICQSEAVGYTYTGRVAYKRMDL